MLGSSRSCGAHRGQLPRVSMSAKDPIGRSVNTQGPLDAESFQLGGGEDENKRNQCRDDGHDSQDHERLRVVYVL